MGKMGNCDEKSGEVWYAVESGIGYLLLCMGDRRLFVLFGYWIIMDNQVLSVRNQIGIKYRI